MKRLLVFMLFATLFLQSYARRVYCEVRVSRTEIIMDWGYSYRPISKEGCSFIEAANYISENYGYMLVDSRVSTNSVGQIVFYMYKDVEDKKNTENKEEKK